MSQKNKTFGETLAEQRTGGGTLEEAVRKGSPMPRRAPRVSGAEYFPSSGLTDKYRALKATHASGKADVEDYTAERGLGPSEYARGGAVKKGSYTTPQMCGGGKVIKSWGR